MPTMRLRWNDATRVTEPDCLQRIFPYIHRQHEPIDFIDKERRYLQDCNRLQILVTDVNYRTNTGMKELERRLRKCLSGTLRYDYMTAEKLRSIAAARDIDVYSDAAESRLGRVQLIQRLRDSDVAAGPFKLLQLPAELRAEIFSYVVLSEYKTSYSPGPVLPDFPPLLFVNQQIRREAGEIFMKARPILLPCTANINSFRASSLESKEIRISAPEGTLDWLRIAGLDLLPQISSCLLADRVTEGLYCSHVYDIDSVEGTCIYHARLLGQIEGKPLLDNRGLYLLSLDASVEHQLGVGSKGASKAKLSGSKAERIVESFQDWKEQTGEDIYTSRFYGAAILLNWL